MYEQILVPLDGSETAEAALAYAEMLPSRQVKLLQVEPNTKGLMFASASEWEEWRSAREADARAYLERVGERLRLKGRAVEPAFAFGDPADWIIAFAGDADMIAMTTHGRGATGRALFGSVADRVARHAQAPTLLVRAGNGLAAFPQVARVIVPLDGSPLAERALPVAASLASDLGVPIHLLQVLDVDALRPTVQAGMPAAAAYLRSQEEVIRQAEQELDAQAQKLRNLDLTASTKILTGSPAAALLDAIAPPDLVVMTTHGRGGVRRWLLGSVADKLVREAPCPVMLVPSTGPGWGLGPWKSLGWAPVR